MKIVIALLPKYSPVELKEILRGKVDLVDLRGKVDLVEQTMYCHSNRDLFQAYKGVVGLVDGLVEPESEEEEEYY